MRAELVHRLAHLRQTEGDILFLADAPDALDRAYLHGKFVRSTGEIEFHTGEYSGKYPGALNLEVDQRAGGTTFVTLNHQDSYELLPHSHTFRFRYSCLPVP